MGMKHVKQINQYFKTLFTQLICVMVNSIPKPLIK